MTKSITALILVLSSFIFLSCDSGAEASVAQTDAGQSDPGNAAGGIPMSFFKEGKTAIFSGSINEKYSFTALLVISDQKVIGSYYYKGKSSGLSLEGKPGATLTLTEKNDKGEHTGTFALDGLSGKTLTGTWVSPDNTKSFPVKMEEMNAFFLQRDTLSDSLLTIDISYYSFPEYPQIEKSFQPGITSRKEEMKVNVEEMKEDILEWGMPWAYSYDQSLRGWNTRYVSIGISEYEFSGGAHGNAFVYGSTWDISTGKEIEIDQLYSFDDQFVAALKGYCKKNLLIEQDFMDDEWFNSGLQEHDFSNFFLEPGGLSFPFQSYEIAPYAAGMPEVFIPFGELEEFELQLLKEIKAAQ